MNKFNFLKEYTYTSILDIDFNVIIYFDYDNEMLLYSLQYEDKICMSSGYLIEFASSLSDDKIKEQIKSFMLDYVASDLNCYIEEHEYDGWKVAALEDGIKLTNDVLRVEVKWYLIGCDEDYWVIQNKVKEFLNNQKTSQ